MIHVVFGESDVKVMAEVILLDESLAGEITQIKDDLSVGPLQNCYVGEGIEMRKQWWREVLAGGEYAHKVDDGSVDDYKTIAELVGTMRRNEEEIMRSNCDFCIAAFVQRTRTATPRADAGIR